MIKVSRYLCFGLIMGLLLQFSSCGGSDEPDPEPETEVTLSTDKTTISFTADGGTENLTITSNAIWRLDYESGQWASSSLQSTKGNATVKITASANSTSEERSMDFTLSADGADDIVITITQAAGEEETEVTEPVLADYIDPDQTGMRDLTSMQLAAEMGLGWNLGNSLESILSSGDTFTGNETSWGNPAVTQQLIDSVKAAGFNTIRIPVAWSHQFVDEDSFTISYEWKLRVEEVVNYALANDMYVIMNIHWDGGWMDHPDYDDQDEINDRLAIMWQQIAKFFRDYDDHLLFAGTNEVHVEGSYSNPTAENAEVQNSFNQTFINTVRATGGKNTYRHLVVQTFNTNIDHGVNYFTVPEDPTADRMMVEVHFYDPYQFTLDESGSIYLWGEDNAGSSAHTTWGDEDWVDEAFGDAKAAFVDQGYPVIMGEYGAILRTTLATAAYEQHVESRNYYLHYVTSKALENGIVPVYWDNGATGNNGFGLFTRSTGATAHADALEAIISALD